MTTTPAKTLTSRYKKTKRKFENTQELLSTSKSVECNPVTREMTETHPSSRKIIRSAKCNHKVTDLEKKRDYTSIKNAELEQELSSLK